jgi:hypothetical protein
LPLTDRLVARKIGSDNYQQLIGQLNQMATQAGNGRGAPSADVSFDGARLRTGNDAGFRPSGTQFFQGSGNQAAVSQLTQAPEIENSPGAREAHKGMEVLQQHDNAAALAWFQTALQKDPNNAALKRTVELLTTSSTANAPMPTTSGALKRATVQDVKDTVGVYKSIPGGVVLEGTATGLGKFDDVQYDPRFNAFILDNHAAYFMKIPPKTVALLCRAIAEDDKERVGVSLGKVELVYGKVPKDSDLSWDMKMADHFMGDIVFAQNNWTKGYNFADGFTPARPNEFYNVAVFFKFNGFEFQIQNEEISLSKSNFDAQIIPLSESVSQDGGHLPDENAITQGRIPEAFENNARHVAEHISYYRRERLIDRMFLYGEAAAFIRALKSADFDLEALADRISTAR